MIRAAQVLSLSLLIATLSSAQGYETSSLAEVFESANVAASRGDYARAVSGYQTLVEAGVRDSDVFFNLATSFAQSGDYPRAILNYERALQVRPNDDRTRQNLRNAERALEESRAEREGEATIQRSASISEAMYGSFTESALAYVLLVSNFCFFACLAWGWVSRRRSTWLVISVTAAGLLLGLSAFGVGVKAGILRDGPRAIAIDDRVALREAPDERARVRGTARGGDRAQVVGSDRDYLKLQMVSGMVGWAPASAVGLVDLDEGLH